MKRILLFTICISLIIGVSYTVAESDEICCPWVNMNYSPGSPSQKLVFHYDGTFANYNSKDSSKATKRGTYVIDKKWKDLEGNIWYQIKMQDPKSETRYKLAKISSDGKMLEFICKTDKYPTDISSEDTAYCKYNRY